MAGQTKGMPHITTRVPVIGETDNFREEIVKTLQMFAAQVNNIIGNLSTELSVMDDRIKKLEVSPVNVKIAYNAKTLYELGEALQMVQRREPDTLTVVHEEKYPTEKKDDSANQETPKEGSGVASGESL